MTAVLAGLYLYPVKSAAGIACSEAVLGAAGLQHDREWMVVDTAGRFVTQRNEPRLAVLRTAIVDGQLRLNSPAGAAPAIDLQHQGNVATVQVWGEAVPAFDAGAAMAQFLSDWLGRALRLVRFDGRHQRLANQDWTREREVPTLFSDGFPLLVLSQASIDELSTRVGRQFPVERFRPNLLLDAVPAHGEDATAEIVMGAARITLTKACTRCVVTTIDQHTGARTDDEPLRTLKSYRYDAALRGVVFGRNAYPTAGFGTVLRRGDSVQMLPAQPL